MKHSLAVDLNEGITKALDNTGAAYNEWYSLAARARVEVQKLIDRRQDEGMGPNYAQINNELIEHGVAFYNAVIGTFITAGLREEGAEFQRHHARAIQIVQASMSDLPKERVTRVSKARMDR